MSPPTHLHVYEPFTAPSGRTFTHPDLLLVKLLIQSGSILHLDVPTELHSGRMSRHYANLRFHRDVRTLTLLGAHIIRFVRSIEITKGTVPCMIGIPTAGTPLAIAAAIGSVYDSTPFHYRVMREERKKRRHGIDNTWAGPFDPGETYFTVENVSTSATTILVALQRFEEDHFPIDSMHHILLVNRGGAEALRSRGIPHVHVMLEFHDLLAAAVHIGEHSEEVLVEYRQEIADGG